MDHKKLDEFIKKELKNILHRNGLDDWNIPVRVKKEYYKHEDVEEEGVQGSARDILFEYKVAHITLYAGAIESIKEAKEVLQHELFHVILAPYNMFIECIMESRDSPWSYLENEFKLKTHELAVAALEKRERRRRNERT